MAKLTRRRLETWLAEMADSARRVRARKAGAEILQAPETQFYGDRTYRARDPEGHIWTFAQTVEEIAPDVWDKAMGTTTKMRL